VERLDYEIAEKETLLLDPACVCLGVCYTQSVLSHTGVICLATEGKPGFSHSVTEEDTA